MPSQTAMPSLYSSPIFNETFQSSGLPVSIGSAPYWQLIYKALTRNQAMSVQDIYKWFENNTDAMSSGSGWKNSIRYNLSMNAVRMILGHVFPLADSDQSQSFEKVYGGWRLTEQAIREGVQPTTRYRSMRPRKRNKGLNSPHTKKQAAGSRSRHHGKYIEPVEMPKLENLYAPWNEDLNNYCEPTNGWFELAPAKEEYIELANEEPANKEYIEPANDSDLFAHVVDPLLGFSAESVVGICHGCGYCL